MKWRFVRDERTQEIKTLTLPIATTEWTSTTNSEPNSFWIVKDRGFVCEFEIGGSLLHRWKLIVDGNWPVLYHYFLATHGDDVFVMSSKLGTVITDLLIYKKDGSFTGNSL